MTFSKKFLESTTSSALRGSLAGVIGMTDSRDEQRNGSTRRHGEHGKEREYHCLKSPEFSSHSPHFLSSLSSPCPPCLRVDYFFASNDRQSDGGGIVRGRVEDQLARHFKDVLIPALDAGQVVLHDLLAALAPVAADGFFDAFHELLEAHVVPLRERRRLQEHAQEGHAHHADAQLGVGGDFVGNLERVERHHVRVLLADA